MKHTDRRERFYSWLLAVCDFACIAVFISGGWLLVILLATK